jgi:hypothetical protein
VAEPRVGAFYGVFAAVERIAGILCWSLCRRCGGSAHLLLCLLQTGASSRNVGFAGANLDGLWDGIRAYSAATAVCHYCYCILRTFGLELLGRRFSCHRIRTLRTARRFVVVCANPACYHTATLSFSGLRAFLHDALLLRSLTARNNAVGELRGWNVCWHLRV